MMGLDRRHLFCWHDLIGKPDHARSPSHPSPAMARQMPAFTEVDSAALSEVRFGRANATCPAITKTRAARDRTATDDARPYRVPRLLIWAGAVARGFGRQEPARPLKNAVHWSSVAKWQSGWPKPPVEETAHQG